MATSQTSMASALQTVDLVRQNANNQLDPKRKSALGQFMTPSIVARFMASLFAASPRETIRVLDPGAGVGSLTAAFLQRFMTLDGVKRIHATAYEIEEVMQPFLGRVLSEYRAAARMSGVELESSVMVHDSLTRLAGLCLEASSGSHTQS